MGMGGKKKWRMECEPEKHTARCRIAASNLILFIMKCSIIYETMNFHFTYILGKENHFDLQKSVGDVDLNCCGLIPSKNLLIFLVKQIICTMLFYKMLMFKYSHTLWMAYVPQSSGPMTNRFLFPRMLQLWVYGLSWLQIFPRGLLAYSLFLKYVLEVYDSQNSSSKW